MTSGQWGQVATTSIIGGVVLYLVYRGIRRMLRKVE